MVKKLDITGLKYGRLTVIRENGKTKHRDPKWLCKCDCGNEKTIVGSKLKNGETKSCGCYNLEMIRERTTKHGMTKTAMHRKWISLRQRCRYKNDKSYIDYGGRGITVCEEWVNSFQTFMEWSLKNGYSDDLEIDRIDNDLGYSPENCRYITRLKNANNKRNTKFIEIEGVSKPIMEWARENEITGRTIYGRLNRGTTGIDLIRPNNSPKQTSFKEEITSLPHTKLPITTEG